MVRVLRSAVPVILILALAACHQISHGTVVSKKLHPEETVFFLRPSYDGKNTDFVPTWIYYPESYSINVTGMNKKGQIRTEEFFLDKTQFDALAVGDTFYCGSTGQAHCKTDRPQHEVEGQQQSH